jgi:glycosyltransferase involved in cell wall biosynthesis
MGRAAPDVDFFLALHADAELEQLGRSIAGENLVICDRRDLPGRWRWERFTLPRLLRKFAPDVVLDLSSRGLRRPPCPQAILCQRAHYFHPAADWGPETFKNKSLFRLHARHFRRALGRTHLVLCQTPTAQRRLRDSCGFAGRTALCPNALSADVLAAPRAAPVPQNLAAHVGEFKLLCVSRYFPHKNLEALVEVFRRHGQELPDVAAVITILPQHHPKAAALLGRVEALGLSSRILNVGPVGQGELASYYCNCQAMILPTLLESFSGTYLEAMHFGLPILTSDRDFAHAVCGDAALYFDPKDPDSIFEVIRGLRLDPALGQRLVERGRRRLAAFPTWDRIAQDLMAELRRIARPPE